MPSPALYKNIKLLVPENFVLNGHDVCWGHLNRGFQVNNAGFYKIFDYIGDKRDASCNCAVFVNGFSVFKKNGFVVLRQKGTSHVQMRNLANGRQTTVPDHGSKPLGKGLEQAILKQAGLKK